MKIAYILFLSVLSMHLSLSAQREEAMIPTEVSEPPYRLGNLVTEQGYYIEQGEEEPRINFRIVDNKLRVYWIDADGLIAEPEYESAVVRFTGSVRGRSYFKLELLPEGAGLGAPGLVSLPHIYSVVLVFSADEEPVIHSFRYTPSMDDAVDPTAGTEF